MPEDTRQFNVNRLGVVVGRDNISRTVRDPNTGALKRHSGGRLAVDHQLFADSSDALANNNPKAVRDAMKNFIAASNKYNNNFTSALDFKGGIMPGKGTSSGVEHQFFNDMLSYYKQLEMGMIPS